MEKCDIRKLPLWVKVLICFIITAAVTLTGIYVYIDRKLDLVVQLDNMEIIPPEKEYFETDDYEKNVTENETETYNSYDTGSQATVDYGFRPSDENMLEDQDTINILLIGQDRRPGETRARSDSMMIGTINKKENTLKLTSLMRDLYLHIPGYSDNRINAAYAFGGMKLLNTVIEKNFQIRIDGNVEVDFERFEHIVNMIGGLDIYINDQEANYLTIMGFEGLTQGMTHMDGSLALEYSRIRYIGNADYERTERQKKLIITAYNKVKDLGLAKILELVDKALPMIKTDLSHTEIIGYAISIVDMGVDNIETYRIPSEGTFTSAKIKGMYVLVPDLAANRTILKDIILGK